MRQGVTTAYTKPSTQSFRGVRGSLGPGGGGRSGEAMVKDIYERSANFIAHLGAWGLEQVGHGLGAANKRLVDPRAHDGGSDNPSAERSRGNRRTARKRRTGKGR